MRRRRLEENVVVARASAIGTISAKRLAVYTVLVVAVRGLALWVLIPLVVVGWLLTAPVRLIRRFVMHLRHPKLTQYIAWADEALIATLEVTLLRPLGVRNGFPHWPRPGERFRKGSLTDAW